MNISVIISCLKHCSMIYSLQSIRFILALLIFHHHYFFNPHIEQFGTFPVAFFFILSGFLLSVGYTKKIHGESFSYRKFVLKRLVRIYPLNWIGLFLFLLYPILVVVYMGEFTAIKDLLLIPDLLLLQSWCPYPSVYLSGNSVCWFLSDIVFCYLLFPFIIKNKNYLFHHGLFWLILSSYFVGVAIVKEEYIHGLIYINPIFRLVDFVLGIRLFYFANNLTHKNIVISSINKSVIEFIVILISVLAMSIHRYVPTRISCASLYWLPSMLLILVFTIHAKNGGGIFSKIFNLKGLVNLGSLSFPFYVFHVIIISWFWEVKSLLCINTFAGAFICIILNIFLSYMYMKYIEPPLNRKLSFLYE